MTATDFDAIRAITFDLDDTLWDNRPVIMAAERSLYDYGLATYDAADSFRHEDSAGFVWLWGLGIETWSARQGPGSS